MSQDYHITNRDGLILSRIFQGVTKSQPAHWKNKSGDQNFIHRWKQWQATPCHGPELCPAMHHENGFIGERPTHPPT